jgi:hypothetical protein
MIFKISDHTPFGSGSTKMMRLLAASNSATLLPKISNEIGWTSPSESPPQASTCSSDALKDSNVYTY